MVNHTELSRLSLAEAFKLREQANDLLNRLILDREQSERRLAETGKRDPMKFITGRTALEGAISTTRQLIHEMDALVVGLENTRDASACTQVAPARPVIRLQPKSPQKSVHRPAHAVAIT
jgi:hypothetical protein